MSDNSVDEMARELEEMAIAEKEIELEVGFKILYVFFVKSSQIFLSIFRK